MCGSTDRLTTGTTLKKQYSWNCVNFSTLHTLPILLLKAFHSFYLSDSPWLIAKYILLLQTEKMNEKKKVKSLVHTQPSSTWKGCGHPALDRSPKRSRHEPHCIIWPGVWHLLTPVQLAMPMQKTFCSGKSSSCNVEGSAVEFLLCTFHLTSEYCT